MSKAYMERTSGCIARCEARAHLVPYSILTAGYYILQRPPPPKISARTTSKRKTVRATRRLLKRLESLGHKVIPEPSSVLIQQVRRIF